MLKTKSIVKRIALLSALILSFSSFNLYAAAAEGGPAPTDESSSDGESGADRGTNSFVDPNLPGKIFKIKNLASNKYINVHAGYDENGANVYQHEDENNSGNTWYNAQEFRLELIGSSFRIHPICSMNGRYRVLSVLKSGSGVAGLTPGCNIQTYTPTDDIAQLFKIDEVQVPIIDPESGATTYLSYHKITMKENTGLAITAYGSANGTSSGTDSTSAGNIYINTYTGAYSQLWILEESDKNAKETYYSGLNFMYPFGNSSTIKTITSGYGNRTYPDPDFHNGIDIGASSGTILKSMCTGTVTKIGKTKARGNFIKVETNCYVYGSTSVKISFLYQHLQEPANTTNPNLTQGCTVTTSTTLGKVGSTGYATGPHLHLEIIEGYYADSNTKVDPLMFFPNIGFTFSS